ncbi:MAG: serine/threonine-protein kinase [Verrucomicrobiia bacterium]
MPSERACAECGQRLAEDIDESLCPVCALREIAEESADGAAGALAMVDPELKPRPADAGRSGPVSSLTGSFGDYELIEEIARGGMGVVCKARQRTLNRTVALKMVLGGPMASATARQRFLAEAQAAAGLQHPNIIAIHEVGQHEGQPFFSMDYVEGPNLAALLRDGPLPARRAAAYAKTIAEAVAYAHQKGILHRDLKPSNVLIDPLDQTRVTDFGLAKQLSGDSDLTVSGQVLGSPNFMAPEQAQGRHREIGPGSDVYSLGALLYHLLTGRPPFQAATLTEVLRQVATTEPAAPRLLNAGIPRDLETICLKCLEKDISRRYPTAQWLANELSRFLRGEPILARPVGVAGKAAKWCQRNPLPAGAVGLAVLALLAGLAGVAWQWKRAEAEALLNRRNAYAAALPSGY